MAAIKKDYLCSLYDILTRIDIDDFEDLGGTWVVNPNDPDHKCLYIKTSEDSKVLAVGHTDYVMFTDNPKMSYDCTKIKAPQLDDRLGVWAITSLLPDHLPADMPYDILLTDFEEKGQSTAILFTPDEGKQYNWIFEFDRKGSDVVMYDYETKELKKLLEDYEFTVGKGSFTDIAVMDRLNCAAFNFGTGYHNEHTKDCYADLNELMIQLIKFRKFYTEQYNVHLIGDTAEVARSNSWKKKYIWEAADKKKLSPSQVTG